MRFGFISTYPPTMCGLASYTDSLALHVAGLGLPLSHVVRTREEGVPAPPPPVQSHAIVVGDLVSNRTYDHWRLNSQLRNCDVVVVQHEFGIFGGNDGEEVLSVLQWLEMPSIVVLHTVLSAPTQNQRRIIEEIGVFAQNIVVMTESAFSILSESYEVPLHKVSVIPHGVPVHEQQDDTTVPGQILTWGLIGPGKGIEWGIMALSLMKDSVPHAHYRVIGQTHPKVFEREGNTYLQMLKRLALELGISDRVSFETSYLPLNELNKRIAQAEVVLLPYEAREQVTSGVLVEALSAEKPVVATNFPHARELIDGTNGKVVQHESPIHMAQALEILMEGDKDALFPRPHQPALNQDHSWPSVAQSFYDLAHSHISEPALR
jgi:glycosyltransferase involved in cell wall biosynthesis